MNKAEIEKFEPLLVGNDVKRFKAFVRSNPDMSYVVQPKLDGVRCYFSFTSDGIVMFSRSGKRYHAFEKAVNKRARHLLRHLFETFSGIIFDSEIIPTDKKNRATVTGKGHSKHLELELNKDFEIHVFDAYDTCIFTPYDSFTDKYFWLVGELVNITTSGTGKSFFHPVSSQKLITPTETEFDDIIRYLKTRANSESLEGFVIRPDIPVYLHGRSYCTLKVKPDNYCLLNIELIDIGDFPKRGLTGTVKRLYGTTYTGLKTWVGSGLTDTSRTSLLFALKSKNYPVHINDIYDVTSLGIKAFVKFECVSSTGTSLNHPRIVKIYEGRG